MDARLRWGGRNRCSGPLGFAEALTLAARVRSASLGRSKWPLELARLRWGGRNRCSGLLGRPRWGARQRCSSFMRKSYSKTLCSGRDSLWTPGSVRLSSEHGYARVRASIYIYIYIYIYLYIIRIRPQPPIYLYLIICRFLISGRCCFCCLCFQDTPATCIASEYALP